MFYSMENGTVYVLYILYALYLLSTFYHSLITRITVSCFLVTLNTQLLAKTAQLYKVLSALESKAGTIVFVWF